MDKKSRLLDVLVSNTTPNIEYSTLYGVKLVELNSVEELKILAYWALSKYAKANNPYG